MKIEKIKRVCKSNKTCILSRDEHGAQWIGNGATMYLIEGMPEISRENLPALMDIPEDKTADWILQEGSVPCFASTANMTEDDQEMEHLLNLEIQGEKISAWRSDEDKLILIKDMYMGPVAAEFTDISMRTGIGLSRKSITYAVVKRGFLSTAIIFPQKLTAEAEGLCEKIEALAELVRYEVNEAKPETIQTSMIDEEAAE